MGNNPKILIATGIYPPDIGGPATQIERLAADLVAAGFLVAVLTYGAPAKRARPFKLLSVSRNWPAPLRRFFYGWKTFWLARRADTIYAMDLYSPGYYSMLAAKFWRKKLVVRFAGDSAWETALNCGITDDDISVFQEKTYNDFIEKRKIQRTVILKSAQAVVAVSYFMKNLAVKIGVSPEKIQVIYNAVDSPGQIPQRQKPPQPVLVTACRLVPWKGVAMLIKIMPSLKQKFPAMVLQVLGDGPEKQKLIQLAKDLGAADNLIFHGRVSQEQTWKIFSQSTIFVLNTNYEGLSHTILEALTAGLPVVTTPAGGNPEVIISEENGLLVPYNHQTAWLAAILRLLSDEELQKKFIINGQKTLEKFRWEELARRTEAVLGNKGF